MGIGAHPFCVCVCVCVCGCVQFTVTTLVEFLFCLVWSGFIALFVVTEYEIEGQVDWVTVMYFYVFFYQEMTMRRREPNISEEG